MPLREFLHIHPFLLREQCFPIFWRNLKFWYYSIVQTPALECSSSVMGDSPSFAPGHPASYPGHSATEHVDTPSPLEPRQGVGEIKRISSNYPLALASLTHDLRLEVSFLFLINLEVRFLYLTLKDFEGKTLPKISTSNFFFFFFFKFVLLFIYLFYFYISFIEV